MAYHVLIGGEAHELQGTDDVSERELVHTSVGFVGKAYEKLREAGVPRERIVTIAQVGEYLQVLRLGEEGKMNTGIPKRYYAAHREKTEALCRRLLDEGGADYDGKTVHALTVWNVLLGEAVPKAVPHDAPAVHFAVYSHGNSHRTIDGDEAKTTEWYFNLPYAPPRGAAAGLFDFVAYGNAKRPFHAFYATQLRAVLHRLFSRCPSRPVVGLLNYCRSGGNVNFLRDGSTAALTGAARWPLLLMSSSQPDKDSLVSGLWETWFAVLGGGLRCNNPSTLGQCWTAAERLYYRENLFELLNHVKSRCYPRELHPLDFSFPGAPGVGAWDPWHIDLKAALLEWHETSDESVLDALQNRYSSGAAYRQCVRCPSDGTPYARLPRGGFVVPQSSNQTGVPTGRPFAVRLFSYQGDNAGEEVVLRDQVVAALADIACPVSAHGQESDILHQPVTCLV